VGDHLVSKKSLSQNFGPLDWRPKPVKIGQKTQNTPTLRASTRRTPQPNQKFFFNRTKKTCRIHRGFEQLSSYSGWRVITKKPRANLLARAIVKGHLAYVTFIKKFCWNFERCTCIISGSQCLKPHTSCILELVPKPFFEIDNCRSDFSLETNISTVLNLASGALPDLW